MTTLISFILAFIFIFFAQCIIAFVIIAALSFLDIKRYKDVLRDLDLWNGQQ